MGACVHMRVHLCVHRCSCVFSACNNVLSESCVDVPLCTYAFSCMFMYMYKWHAALLSTSMHVFACIMHGHVCERPHAWARGSAGVFDCTHASYHGLQGLK